MTAAPKVLVAGQDLPNASALLYTSPAAGKGTWIDKATCCNHDVGAHSVQFYVVAVGGAAASSNIVVQGKSLAPAATDLLPELVGKFLNAGDKIYGNAEAATVVSVAINGRELT